MKRNIPYLVLNSAALGIAVLGISGIAALMVGSVLVLSLVMLKLDKYIPDPLVWSFLFILFGVMLAGGMDLAWTHGRHKLVQEEKKSRGQSILLWETPAFLLFFLLFYIAWEMDHDWPLLIGLAVVGLYGLFTCFFYIPPFTTYTVVQVVLMGYVFFWFIVKNMRIIKKDHSGTVA